MRKEYKIGEFAQNLGVSTGFLKHHENHGLLRPNTSQSGYRYYEMGQAVLATQCLSMQNIGFTGKEIAEIMQHSSSLDLPELMQEKKEEIRRQMVFYEEMLRELECIYPSSPTQQEAERWEIGNAAPFYSMENSRDGDFFGTEEHSSLARDWNRYMPVTQVFSRIELSAPSASFDAISIWNMGLKIDAASADRLHVHREEPARLVDPGKCLIFHFSGIRRRLKGRDALHDMLSVPFSLCTRYHLKPRQELYIFNMFGSTMEPENYIRETVLIPLDES